MTLKLEIAGRSMDVTDRIQDYVEKRVSKLDKYLSGMDEARVDLAHIKTARSAADRHVAQITVRGRGFILRAEERSDNILEAFDSALDKIQRRINRYKGKRTRTRDEGFPVDEMELSLPEEEDEETSQEPLIARRKRFSLVPMDEMEAIEQMSLLGHENFFVFYNAKTNGINVLYRRRDGTYGLIEPEIG